MTLARIDTRWFTRETQKPRFREPRRTSVPGNNAAAYRGLNAGAFRELEIGEPKGRTKKTPMLQVAYLYPMAKAGYDAVSCHDEGRFPGRCSGSSMDASIM